MVMRNMQAIVTCGKTCGCALRTLRTRGHSRHSLHFEHPRASGSRPPRAVWLRRCAALQRKYGRPRPLVSPLNVLNL